MRRRAVVWVPSLLLLATIYAVLAMVASKREIPYTNYVGVPPGKHIAPLKNGDVICQEPIGTVQPFDEVAISLEAGDRGLPAVRLTIRDATRHAMLARVEHRAE